MQVWSPGATDRDSHVQSRARRPGEPTLVRLPSLPTSPDHGRWHKPKVWCVQTPLGCPTHGGGDNAGAPRPQVSLLPGALAGEVVQVARWRREVQAVQYALLERSYLPQLGEP